MSPFTLPHQVMLCFCGALSLSLLGCGTDTNASNDGTANETSVVPGSTCEIAGDSSGARLDLLFPGRLNAAEIVAIMRWSNADASCAEEAPDWGTSLGDLAAVARWENSTVYVRGNEELLIDTTARIVVLMDCPEAKFLGAEVRLDTARDGQGKLMAKCTSAY